ncbi:MAG: restriction endonuclease subunit S [Acidobacteria bacterium]|nr:restriction endonuclease subunit S [Acidobacteriota bacterium]
MGSGGTPATGNPDFYDGEIPWVQTGDLNDDWLSATAKTITEKGLRQSTARLYPAKTLLMAMYGATIGKLGILQFPATVNQACCALVPRNVVSVRFMPRGSPKTDHRGSLQNRPTIDITRDV